MQENEESAAHEADVVIIGFGSAGGCAAIEARDLGVEVVILEKQPENAHFSNTRAEAFRSGNVCARTTETRRSSSAKEINALAASVAKVMSTTALSANGL